MIKGTHNKMKNLFIAQQNKEDIRISFFIISFFFVKIINATIKSVLNIPAILYPVISLGFAVVLFFSVLITVFPIIKRSFLLLISLECLWIIIYVFSYFNGEAELPVLIRYAAWTIGVCIPIAVYMHSIKDKQIFYNLFLKSSYFMSIILSLIVFFR
jgi:hypothetical protein